MIHSNKNIGGRSYNYKEKYAPDPSGERLSDNARVWKGYLPDEAESYDDDMLKGYRDTIDSLLVFVSILYSLLGNTNLLFIIFRRHSSPP